MGGGAWTQSDWNGYTASRGITAQSKVSQIYTQRAMKDNLNPLSITVRESCDSSSNPNSTAIIFGVDITGSMGYLAEEVAKNTLNKAFVEIYDKKPVSDPHIAFMAIGDAFSDRAPLQVTQFEADIKIAEQLGNVYFECCGGSNGGESYLLAWYFASRHTKIDCFDKHGRKGFLFTIGDEPNHSKLTKEQIKRFIGDDVECDLTAEMLLDEVSRKYEVFHMIVGNYHNVDSTIKKWRTLMGERALRVTDHTKIPEIVVSTMEILGGKDIATVSGQWDGSTSVVVNTAIKGLTAYNSSTGLVKF